MNIIYYISSPLFYGILLFIVTLFVFIIWLIFKIIKRNTKAFKKGYNDALPLTENETLLKNIAQLKEVDFESKEKLKFGQKAKGSSYQAIRQEWKAIIEQNQNDIKRLYERGIITDWNECKQKMENDYAFEDDIYNLLVTWLQRIDWSDLEEVKTLFKYTELVSNNDYPLNPKILLKYHKSLLTHIKTLMQKEDFVIIPRLHTETLGSLINNLIELYYYHSSFNFNSDEKTPFDINKEEVAQIIPSFIKAFPDVFPIGLTYSILEKNTDNLEEVYADLLRFFINNKTAYIFTFARSLYGKDQRPSDVVYQKSVIILKNTLEKQNYTTTQIDYLIEKIFFYNLSINTLEYQEKAKIKHIEKLKNFNSKDTIIKKQEQELVDLKNNFEDSYTKNWISAVRRVAVSLPTFQSIQILIDTFPNHPKIATLTKLIQEAKDSKDKPKTYNLLVIEELMYNQEVLKPKFDVRVFSKEYIKREIDVEDDGYAIIPEVKKYFKNLDIPKELLVKVTTLYQDSGYGGGSEFIYELFPFWDPGCGDEVFKVSDKMLDDLALLPNLKTIIGLENSEPSKEVINTLEAKNITLVEEEDY